MFILDYITKNFILIAELIGLLLLLGISVHVADKAMYEDKARLKKAVLDSGGELHNRTN